MKVFAAALISVFLCSSVAVANPRTFDVPAAHLYPSNAAVRYQCDRAEGYAHARDLFFMMGILTVAAGVMFAVTADNTPGAIGTRYDDPWATKPLVVPITLIGLGMGEVLYSGHWKTKAKKAEFECKRLTGRG